ncbi:MAG: hypothetical protein ABFS86_16005 [Planctomycetota bacterium]
MPADGWCRACGKASPPDRWEDYTESHPIQPEEHNGRRCLHCEGEVTVHVPRDAQNFTPWVIWALLGGTMFAMAIGGWAKWSTPAWYGVLVLVVSPWYLLYRRYRGPQLLDSIFVACPGCNLVRIGGRVESTPSKRYWRGAALFDSAYRWTVAVFAFFVVTWLGAQVTGTHFPPATLALLIFSGFTLHSVRWYRGAFGLRSWW